MKVFQLISIILLVLVILNLTLFAFGKITAVFFWITLVFSGIIAYKIMPYFKKK